MTKTIAPARQTAVRATTRDLLRECGEGRHFRCRREAHAHGSDGLALEVHHRLDHPYGIAVQPALAGHVGLARRGLGGTTIELGEGSGGLCPSRRLRSTKARPRSRKISAVMARWISSGSLNTTAGMTDAVVSRTTISAATRASSLKERSATGVRAPSRRAPRR